MFPLEHWRASQREKNEPAQENDKLGRNDFLLYGLAAALKHVGRQKFELGLMDRFTFGFSAKGI
jgi:hypothetical protein